MHLGVPSRIDQAYVVQAQPASYLLCMLYLEVIAQKDEDKGRMWPALAPPALGLGMDNCPKDRATRVWWHPAKAGM